jgi:hypothetical protein
MFIEFDHPNLKAPAGAKYGCNYISLLPELGYG